MSIQNELRRDEGYRVWPYKDSRGLLTWGIGHNLDASPLCPSAAASLATAIQEQFDYDLANTIRELSHYTWYSGLNEARQAACQNMMFNLGAATFAAFVRFIEYMATGQYTAASVELSNSLAAKQDVIRYQRLAVQISTGIEQ